MRDVAPEQFVFAFLAPFFSTLLNLTFYRWKERLERAISGSTRCPQVEPAIHDFRQKYRVTPKVELRCCRLKARAPLPGPSASVIGVLCRSISFANKAFRRFSSEERRVGKECGSTCSSRWSP